ncbi:MAG: hypothetical protein U1E42_05120 [Rhodospirillales bacterium]
MWKDHLEPSIRQLESKIATKLPADSDFELWVPADIRIGSRNFGQFCNHLERWAVEIGPSLGRKFPWNVKNHQITCGRYIVPVRLGRYPLGFCRHRSTKRFHIQRTLAVDEAKDVDRSIRDAFQGKDPKLSERKRDGLFSILALEWTSPLATLENPILHAGRILNGEFPHVANRVVIVYTVDDVWSLQYADLCQPDDEKLFQTTWWLYNPSARLIWQWPHE